MKSQIKLKKLLSMALILCAVLSLASCKTVVSEANGKLVFKELPEILLNSDYNEYYNVDYIDYDEFFLKDGEEQPTTGRYSNITSDGKVRWDLSKEEIKKYLNSSYDNPKIVEFFDKITVNGKKITLPCKFSDISEEYAIFDKVDFTMIGERMFPFTITDKDTSNKVYGQRYSDILKPTHAIELIDKNNSFIATMYVNFKENNIDGISTSSFRGLSQIDLRIDGIGVGNTLNEVYDKFGMPCIFDSKDSIYQNLYYPYTDVMGKKYEISFYYLNKVKNFKKMEEGIVRNNLITGVSVSCGKEK